MNLTKSLAVGFSLAAFSGGYALAQQAQPAPAQQPQTQQQQAQAPQQQRQAGKQTQQMSPDQLRVSELKGKQVYDRNGSEIGEIEDLVFDLQSHQVHAAIVQVGGMVGGKDYAFPLSDFKVGEKDRLVLEVDKKRMENADGFAKGQWPELGNEYWGREKSAQAGTASAAGASAGGVPSAGGQGGVAGAAAQAGQKNLVRASEMMGKDIKDPAGEDVGQVNDVIVSLNDAAIKGIRIDVDNAGQTVIEPKMITAGLDKKLVVDTSAEQLRRRSETQQQDRGQGGQSEAPASSPQPANPQR